MTLTATRPAESAGAPTDEPSHGTVVPESPFTTSDHKRIGRYYIVAALVFVLVSTVVAVVMEISLTSTSTSTLEYDRLFSLHSTSASLLFLPLLFLGLGTYLVPLQIGARRLAFPRVQALALWGTVVGGLLLISSYLFGQPNGWGIAYPTALPFAKVGASRATDLWVASLVLITVSLVTAAANLFVTALKLRVPGMTTMRMPAFTWSIMAVCVGIILSAPVFAGGLLLLYLDQHFGGGVFAPAQRHSNYLWQHTLWLYGRPDVYLVIVPALGALTDVIATHARRPLLQSVVVKGLIFVTMILCFGVIVADSSIERAVLIPTPTVLTLFIAIPIGLVVQVLAGGDDAVDGRGDEQQDEPGGVGQAQVRMQFLGPNRSQPQQDDEADRDGDQQREHRGRRDQHRLFDAAVGDDHAEAQDHGHEDEALDHH